MSHELKNDSEGRQVIITEVSYTNKIKYIVKTRVQSAFKKKTGFIQDYKHKIPTCPYQNMVFQTNE